jgi:hypothetical protein
MTRENRIAFVDNGRVGWPEPPHVPFKLGDLLFWVLSRVVGKWLERFGVALNIGDQGMIYHYGIS